MTKRKDAIKIKLSKVLPHLNEKQRRILAAAEANALGRGGIQKISSITGLSRPTLYRGLKDLKVTNRKNVNVDQIRASGGGRKRAEEKNPKILEALHYRAFNAGGSRIAIALDQ